MALTQRHPSSWAFLRAFELLCEDMDQEPLLNIFFQQGGLDVVEQPAQAIPVATARPTEEKAQPSPVVVVESAEESPPPMVEEVGGSSSKRTAKEGVLQGEEQLSKRGLAAEDRVEGDVNFNYSTFMAAGRVKVDDTWVGVMTSRPLSPLVFNPQYLVSEVVNKCLGCLMGHKMHILSEPKKGTIEQLTSLKDNC
ncbi:hypothetical protein CR513_26542, partial [Mucuna pruriens]